MNNTGAEQPYLNMHQLPETPLYLPTLDALTRQMGANAIRIVSHNYERPKLKMDPRLLVGFMGPDLESVSQGLTALSIYQKSKQAR